jgi:protein TonB
MKLLNAKNFSSIISFIFHLTIFVLIFFVFNHKTEHQDIKLIEVGFAGAVESNSPGSPGSGIIKKQKLSQPKINSKKKLPKEKIKRVKKINEIPKNPPPTKKFKKNISTKDTSSDSKSSNTNLASENSNGNPGNGGSGNGQNGSGPAKEGTPDQDNNFHVAVDQMPEPIGGIEGIDAKAFYPPQAKENKIQGTVYVLAYIDENGYVRKTVLIKGIGYGCDQSAIRAVGETRFSPGILKGVHVKVQLTIPVTFNLH